MPDQLTAHLADFRGEVREFIAGHAPAYRQRSGVRSPEDAEELADLQRWTRELYAAGYVGADWPVEHGGTPGHDRMRDLVVSEELAHAEAPPPAGGSTLAAQALIGFGTPEQQAHYLPRIRSGEDLWCQLFSEPDAGSDLASLRTRADLQAPSTGSDEAHYVVNGQKVWTTNGQWAGLGLLLARTDREAPKHRGISAFVVDMASEGVSVSPLREITGTSDFNEVFLDDVRVPADHLIGEPGRGWLIANTTLAHERTAVGASVVNLQDAWQRLWLQVADPAVSGSTSVTDVRRELAEIHVAIEALSHFAHDVLSRWQAGVEAPDDAAIAKLVFSELNLRLSELAVRTLGTAGAAVEGDLMEFDDGRWQDAWLYARAYTIAGGTSEIMRTVIAERGLGLPR